MNGKMLMVTLIAAGLLTACGQQQPAASSSTGIQSSQIKLDTQGLPYSWQPVLVPATPYDASQPSDPTGLPEHIQILFGATTVADRKPDTPVIYIIPVDAYKQIWDDAGNQAVSTAIDNVFKYTAILP